MRSILMLMVILSVLVLTACQPVSPEQANADFCADLDAYKASLDGVAALTAENTVEEASAAFDAVADARDDLNDSANTLANLQLDQLDEAYEDLDDAIRDVDSSAVISD